MPVFGQSGLAVPAGRPPCHRVFRDSRPVSRGRRRGRAGRRAGPQVGRARCASKCRPCSTVRSMIPHGKMAAVVEDLHVVVSDEFGTPGERSRIYVAFDDDNLYFAARFFDSRPGTIVAKVLSKRDVSFGEDGFSVTLDPYDQARAGYIFDVNPNGMRSEAIYTDKDRQNWDWEGIWDAAARIDGEGWTAEVAIPLKTLSFDPARDGWGLNFTRWHGVDSEQFGWMSYNRSQDLSRTGLVTGLAGLKQGHGLDIVPGLRTGATRNHDTDEEDDFLEPSLDVFWKITPSLTAAVTLNPDFSGTTADTRQINLTRFDLFFPEQRAFFLQDSDIFQFAGLEEESGIPFFSRRIGLDDEGKALTLDAGLKLAGRTGRSASGSWACVRTRRSVRNPWISTSGASRWMSSRSRASAPSSRAAIPTPASTTASSVSISATSTLVSARTASSRRRPGISRPTPKDSRATIPATVSASRCRTARVGTARSSTRSSRRITSRRSGSRHVRISRRLSAGSATPGALKTAGSAASRPRSAPSSSSRSMAATAATRSRSQLFEVENQAADRLTSVTCSSRRSSRSPSRFRKAS